MRIYSVKKANLSHSIQNGRIFQKPIDKSIHLCYNKLKMLHLTQYVRKGDSMRLSEIASVRTGLVLSRKEAKTTNAVHEYHQLNLKAVTDNGTICLEDTTCFRAAEALPSNYLTQAGDVIVKLSEPYTAAYITDAYAGLVIPSHFVVIRTDPRKVLPQYIAWYLNKDRIKKAYSMTRVGVLKQIKPTTIAETEIRLPSLERQKQVIELYEMSRTELQLMENLLRQKEAYYKALLNKINRM